MGPGVLFRLAAIAVASANVVSVRDKGAAGDGINDDTRAFEAALDDARTTPGTTVAVPAGRYLIRPINLTNHTTLELAADATIVGVTNVSAWPVIPGAPSYGQGRDHVGPRFTSLIHGEHLENVTVRGAGPSSVLDGNGAYWWPQKDTLQVTRGHLVEFMYSTRVRIYDVQLLDSPFWNTHIYDCDDVHVRGVSIEAPGDSPNTDGWDPDSSRNVVIEDSSYSGGDDCVAIKSGWDCFGLDYGKPSKNITVRRVNCTGRYAGIAVGSETSGGVEDVLIQDVNIFSANAVAHVKTGPTRGSYVRNVVFDGITAEGAAALGDGILVDLNYGSPNPSCPEGWEPPAPPDVRDITFKNIKATHANVTKSAVHLVGLPNAVVTGVALLEVHIDAGGWLCANVSGTAQQGTVEPWPPCAEITAA